MKLRIEEFLDIAIDNLEEFIFYIAKGKLNIRMHRDITGKMWYVVNFVS